MLTWLIRSFFGSTKNLWLGRCSQVIELIGFFPSLCASLHKSNVLHGIAIGINLPAFALGFS